MRSDSAAPGALLMVVGVVALAAGFYIWSHPEVLARRNFPLNLTGDDTTPRSWVAAAPFAAIGLALIGLGIATL